MKKESIHSMLLGLVGGYLLFLAWELLDKYRSGSGEMPDAVFIAAIALFTAGGIGVLIYAWIIYRKQREQEKGEAGKQDTEQDGKA